MADHVDAIAHRPNYKGVNQMPSLWLGHGTRAEESRVL
jgi:hypothetical protein